jgi:hypothetical protein
MSQYFEFVENPNPIVKFKKDYFGTYKHPVYYIWLCDEKGDELTDGDNGCRYFYFDELELFKKKYIKLGYDVAVYERKINE